MEKTTEEKARAKLLKFGRKNKWNRAVAVPLLFFVMSFFHIRNYCHNNGKRFAVMLGTFFLFAVYSSFSFPAFITEDTGTDYELKNTDTQNISLAEEKEPDMAGLELLEDEDVLEQSDYNSTSHGYALVDKYDASDILQASEAIVSENADAEKTGEDGSVTEDDNAEQEEFRSDDWRLVLINKQNSIPDDYTFQLGTIKGKMQCDKRILEDLLAMLEAADALAISPKPPKFSMGFDIAHNDREMIEAFALYQEAFGAEKVAYYFAPVREESRMFDLDADEVFDMLDERDKA